MDAGRKSSAATTNTLRGEAVLSTGVAHPHSVLDIPQAAKYREMAFPAVPIHLFRQEALTAMAPGAAPGFIVLDLADRLAVPFPATTPLMLCRYLVLKAGEPFSHSLMATGEIFYVIRGQGSTVSRSREVRWGTGDVFSVPGGGGTRHLASQDTVLFLCTDEPAMSYLGVSALDNASAMPTHFSSSEIERGFASIYAKNEVHQAPGKALSFAALALADSMAITPTLTAAMNSLEPGGGQRPHRHNAAAVTLCISGDGVFSKVGDTRVDWMPYTVMVTPPGLIHSHHNDGPAKMRAFVIQDGGLHYYCRTGMFEHVDQPAS